VHGASSNTSFTYFLIGIPDDRSGVSRDLENVKNLLKTRIAAVTICKTGL
jgi:hypothetical protein